MNIILILQREIHPRDEMVMAVLTARVHDRMKELVLCLKHTHISPAHIHSVLEDVESSMLGLNIRQNRELAVKMDIDIIAHIIQPLYEKREELRLIMSQYEVSMFHTAMMAGIDSVIVKSKGPPP